jgi:phosphoserine phosphatase RsbU/P
MVRRKSCTSSKGGNVMRFVAHTTETAAPAATAELEAAAQTFRFVPNFLGGLAEVPIAPRARVVDTRSLRVPYPVRCSEIWGGNGNADLDVCTNGINASVYSLACGSERGGDVYYLSVCTHDMLTRMVVADVRGHGEQVSQLSAWLHEEIQAHLDTLDGGSMLRSLNGKLFRRGFEALTTAAVLAYHTGDSRLYISSAGHPPALLSRKRHGLWTPVDLSSGHIPSNLPLGVRDSADFGQVAVSVEAGDRVAIYTDGITECTNASGEEFGQERLCTLLEDCCGMDLNATKRCLLEALRLHAGQTPYEDDLTLLLIEISSNNVPNPARGRGARTAAAESTKSLGESSKISGDLRCAQDDRRRR